MVSPRFVGCVSYAARTWERRVDCRVIDFLIATSPHKSLQEPDDPETGDDQGNGAHTVARERRPRAQLPEQREQRGGDGELSDLDAEVERDERTDDRGPVGAEADLLQRGGEAEAVHQAEREREQPAAPGFVAAQQVLGA